MPRDAANESHALVGRRVAFTGRLATMSRATAEGLLAARGGVFAPAVSRSTDLLVVGAAGWPLRPDGRPTRKLARAEALARRGCLVEVLSEEEFLRSAGVTEDGLLGRHTLPAVAALVGLPVRTIEAWARSGFVAAAETRDGVALFDYRTVAAAKSLRGLLAEGVPLRTITRSLARLWTALGVPGGQPEMLSRLSVVAGRVALRTADGRWAEPNGQLILGYETPEAAEASPVLTLPKLTDDLFVRALEREEEEDLAGAAALYRRLLLEEGPDADACFNLGNVLYALGDTPAAAERFRQAAELDPDRADAWFNLGNVLAESGEANEAAYAYRLAAEADPAYADARAELADTLDRLGNSSAAQVHWRAYLELEPQGPWADYARRRLFSRPAS
jgi:tetratricopeptide (TPR) repeat protein